MCGKLFGLLCYKKEFRSISRIARPRWLRWWMKWRGGFEWEIATAVMAERALRSEPLLQWSITTPSWVVLDRESQSVQFNRTLIVSSELMYKKKVMDKRQDTKGIVYMKDRRDGSVGVTTTLDRGWKCHCQRWWKNEGDGKEEYH